MFCLPSIYTDGDVYRWRGACQICCHVANVELTGRLLALMAALRFPQWTTLNADSASQSG